MDPRTLRAVAAADVLGFAGVAGVAWFLGFEVVAAIVAGLVAGMACAGIVLAAALRGQRAGPARPDESANDDEEVTGGR